MGEQDIVETPVNPTASEQATDWITAYARDFFADPKIQEFLGMTKQLTPEQRERVARLQARLIDCEAVEVPTTVVGGVVIRSEWMIQTDPADEDALEPALDPTTAEGAIGWFHLLAHHYTETGDSFVVDTYRIREGTLAYFVSAGSPGAHGGVVIPVLETEPCHSFTQAITAAVFYAETATTCEKG